MFSPEQLILLGATNVFVAYSPLHISSILSVFELLSKVSLYVFCAMSVLISAIFLRTSVLVAEYGLDLDEELRINLELYKSYFILFCLFVKCYYSLGLRDFTPK